jgi:hypothetical protein
MLALSAFGLALAGTAPASAVLFTFSHESGLSAEAEFTLVDSTHLEIRMRNTSTGTPGGASAVDQLLTGVSFDIGFAQGHFADQTLTNGNVAIGANSQSINFDSGTYGEGFDVSAEFGFSNNGDSSIGNHLQNLVAATEFGGNFLPFNGENLNGPLEIISAGAGLLSDAEPIPIGGLAAIQSEVVVSLTLSFGVSGLADIVGNGVRASFGDPAVGDVLYLDGIESLPAPAAISLLAVAGCIATRRRRD